MLKPPKGVDVMDGHGQTGEATPPRSWASFEAMHNHQEPDHGPTGPKPPAQLLPKAQKAKMAPVVSAAHKWHVVNTDTW